VESPYRAPLNHERKAVDRPASAAPQSRPAPTLRWSGGLSIGNDDHHGRRLPAGLRLEPLLTRGGRSGEHRRRADGAGNAGRGAAWLIPLIAGLLLARFGFAPAFDVVALSFLVFPVLAAGMRPVPQTGSAGAGLSSFGAGLRYVSGQRLLVSLLLINLNAMVFGIPSAPFPALGTTRFPGGATTV